MKEEREAKDNTEKYIYIQITEKYKNLLQSIQSYVIQLISILREHLRCTDIALLQQIKIHKKKVVSQ